VVQKLLQFVSVEKAMPQKRQAGERTQEGRAATPWSQ